MSERSHRPTVRPVGAPWPQTEQIEIVVPFLDVTATEVGFESVDVGEGPAHQARLLLVAGPAPGQVYSLGDDCVIGRDSSVDIAIEDAAVSRRHARLYVRGGSYMLEDLGSANGTLVNAQRIIHHNLADGDRIQLGPRVLLRFALLDDAEEKMHRQLFESSTRDPLTRAYNKKYITERLAAEVAHAQRHKSALELVLFDLDRFKQVNDVHGHLVGDAVLRAVADLVHALIRTEDVFGRFGGEEFALITRDCDAAKLAVRIRAAVEEHVIETTAGKVSVTISLGAARLDELGRDASATGLLDLADQRLLRAKRTGRNRVCASD